MADHSPPSTPGASGRRPSLTEMFMPRPTGGPHSSSHSPPSASISTHVGTNAQNHRRGMSITTLGLGGTSPHQSAPMDAFAKQRRASTTSSSASSSPEFRNVFDDGAVIEEEGNTAVPANTPATPSFARRMSFGAQALRDVRGTGPSSGGRHPSLFTNLQVQQENQSFCEQTSPSVSKATTTRGGSRGEAFNWSESLRDRSKRPSSISAGANTFTHRQRAASVATVEVPKEMPKAQMPPAATQSGKPDQLGERMLRGDFMMD